MGSRLIVRMTAPILAISGLLLTVGVVGAWYVQRLQKNNSEILLWNVSSMRAAEELEIGIREVRTQLQNYLITGDPNYLDAVPPLRRETGRWLARAERFAATPQEVDMITRARRGYARFFGRLDRVWRGPPGRTPPGQVRNLVGDAAYDEILGPVHDYLDFNENEVEKTTAENQNLADRLVLGLLLLGTCGAGAGLLAGFGIARGISRSLIQLSVPIRDAAGKLNEIVGPIKLSAGWGLPELEGTLQGMAGQIGTVIDRLQQSQREVLHAEQLAAVGQLAAGMAHELRNPLMSMKILVQAAAERDDPAGLAGRDLAVVEEEITRLEGLIRTFLEFARPPQLEKRVFEAQGMVAGTVALVSGRAEKQGVRVECALPDRPVLIEADLGQLRQVLLNLLLNALDALPGGGTVRAELAGVGPWLLVRVADTGPGLPAQLGDQIFDPFISTKETGLGLGLSICRRIVEAHGGSIAAADRPGGGAVFTVRLPRPGGSEGPGQSPTRSVSEGCSIPR